MNIFSTYSAGENRVTATILAVLRLLPLDHIERLLGALLEDSEFELIRFENQPSKGGTGTPDAVIRASISLYIETKTERNSVTAGQIERHRQRLGPADGPTKMMLLVITPDDGCPQILNSMADKRIVWSSFDTLDQAIDKMLEDKEEVISEREEFLLRELQGLLAAEGLIGDDNDVVVVAARDAWREYAAIHAYLCQPHRSFRRVSRIAFYSEGHIQPLVPKILGRHDDVVMETGRNSGPLGDLVQRILLEKRRELGSVNMVLLLSAPNSPDTTRLPSPIPNNMKAHSGKPTAFTMSQRYIALERLKTAKTTQDLVP